MVQKEDEKNINWDVWFDFLGQMDIPTLHLGGVSATRNLLKLCGITQKQKVLMVGCGTGYTAFEIARKYKSPVIGIDISQDMIAKAREKAQTRGLEAVEFQVADLFDLPFEDETFDVAIMESILTVLSDKGRALHELVRVLKPRGRIGANEDFALPETPPSLLKYITSITPLTEPLPTPQDLRELFEREGLHVISMTEVPAKGALTFREALTSINTIGLSTILSFSWKLITDKALRKAAIYYRMGSYIMMRKRGTRKFFGYALIIAEKHE